MAASNVSNSWTSIHRSAPMVTFCERRRPRPTGSAFHRPFLNESHMQNSQRLGCTHQCSAIERIVKVFQHQPHTVHALSDDSFHALGFSGGQKRGKQFNDSIGPQVSSNTSNGFDMAVWKKLSENWRAVIASKRKRQVQHARGAITGRNQKRRLPWNWRLILPAPKQPRCH